MTDFKKKKGLGRGLSALLDDAVEASAPAAGAEGLRTVPIHHVRPNPKQPRRVFRAEEMEDLTNSIREMGVLQPLLVRADPDRKDGWEIVAGERRWRAAQAAQLHEVPIIIREYSDSDMLEVAIIENVQRDDLNPIDEAEGYNQLIESFGHSQAALAKVIGKSRPYIANALRLLTLPSDVRSLLSEGRLTAGHARALITAEDPSTLARKVVAEGLTVRKTEELARTAARAAAPATADHPTKDADTRVLESDLSASLGFKVAIGHKANGSGSVTIQYKTLDELDNICHILSSDR